MADTLEWLDENSDSEQEDYEEKLKAPPPPPFFLTATAILSCHPLPL